MIGYQSYITGPDRKAGPGGVTEDETAVRGERSLVQTGGWTQGAGPKVRRELHAMNSHCWPVLYLHVVGY